MLMHRTDQAECCWKLVAVAFVGRSSVAAEAEPLASFLAEPSFVDASEVAVAFQAASKTLKECCVDKDCELCLVQEVQSCL